MYRFWSWKRPTESGYAKRRLSGLALVSVILCGCTTFLLTAIPLSAQQRALISGRDKLIHTAVFALLTVCVAWALAGFLHSRIRVMILTAVLVLIFASLDEFAQRYVPTRTVEWWDWLANCLGIVIGVIGYALLTLLFSVIAPKAKHDIGRPLER